MIEKKEHKFKFLGLILGCFFAVIGVMQGLLGPVPVFADENPNQVKTDETEVQLEETVENNSNEAQAEESETHSGVDSSDRRKIEDLDKALSESENAETSTTQTNTPQTISFGDSWTEKASSDCEESLGELKWLVCPATGKIAEAVDWLYARIDGVLRIDPISMDDDSPVYNIWKYFLTVTNILFIIFLVVVIYSQITGLGINNYGVKKTLPKMIVAAVLVNLSFIGCSALVDVSNVIGDNVRGLFASIGESTVQVKTDSSVSVEEGDFTDEEKLQDIGFLGSLFDEPQEDYSDEEKLQNIGFLGSLFDEPQEDYSDEEKLRGVDENGYGVVGTLLGVGAGVLAFETGAIWMLIPVLLGALVSVITGLITIAMRQAIVTLLIMISPLAMVAYILPNTGRWFTKWWDLLKRMLVFYPMFSLLFGASNLAGYVIIASAKDWFGILLGLAVQIFPLFYSWTLMKMSGTILGMINTKLNGLMAKPLMANRMWAMTRKQDTRWSTLVHGTTPSARLMAYLEKRKVARVERTKEHMMTVRNSGLAYMSTRHYKADGTPSREGERADYEQALNMEYQKIIMEHKNNMNKGLGQLEVVKAEASAAQKVRLHELDIKNVKASDALKMETSRGAKIDYEPSVGYFNRVNDANFANADLEAWNKGNFNHQFHRGVLNDPSNIERYNAMKKIMEGNEHDVGFILADAAHSYTAQSQIVKGKFGNHFDHIVATQDIVNELNKLTKDRNAVSYIDPIIAGLRTLNVRGDTNLVKDQLNHLMTDRKIQLGTQASQAIASFCMFDVKGNDPSLRRFGKHINMETARMFDEKDPAERRTRKDISFYEYINGECVDYDENGRVKRNSDGSVKMYHTKMKSSSLLTGTSFRDMERTSFQTFDELIRENSMDVTVDAYGNEIKTFNYAKFKKNQEANWKAILPNVLSDHYSFLSGSEQMMAFRKTATGVDASKHAFDWKEILGEDVAGSVTDEQKEDIIKMMHDRTKGFLGAQVPVQIARTKSDMIDAIENQYVLYRAMQDDPELKRKLLTYGYDMSKDKDENGNLVYNYSKLRSKYLGDVKEEFANSFDRKALKGFLKSYNKGYQGEAKKKLLELLNPEELYKTLFPNGKGGRRRNSNVDDDDDDDGPMYDDSDANDTNDGGAIYNETRRMIESIFNSYIGSSRSDVAGYWGEVKNVLNSSDEISSKSTIIDHIEAGLSQYTDVSALHDDIINDVFGGFSDHD